MANSFDSVENLNDYTNVSASAGQIISLSVNTFTNGPLTYYNVVGYAPTSFATLEDTGCVSLSTVNGVSTTTPDNALVIPAGAYITSIILTNNGIPISGPTAIDVITNTVINFGDTPVETIINNVNIDSINSIGYSQTINPYVPNSSSLYVNITVNNNVTAGSLCVYITYFMATNSPTV
jgi:hypothetical protein